MNTNNIRPDFLGKEKPGFKIDGQKIFLTYPRNPTTKEEAMNKLKEFYLDNLEYAIVAREDHKEENVDNTLDASHKHLHIIFKTKNRVQYGSKQSSIFDFIAGKHGSYEGVRLEHNAILYTIKDGDYLTYNIDTTKYLKAKKEKGPTKTTKGVFQSMADDITKDNLTYNDIHIKYSSSALQHGKKIRDFIEIDNKIKEDIQIKQYYDSIYENTIWKPFQTDIIDIIEQPPNSRHIHWIYDTEGNNGKTYLTTYLQLYKNAYVVTGGKHQDIIRHYKNNKVVIFDLSRDYAENESIYNLMEQFKNGYLLDGKYEGSCKRFIPPHIIVMSNSKPHEGKLSKDRIQLKNIGNTQQQLDTNPSIINQEYDEADVYHDNDSNEYEENEDNEEYTITTKETKQIAMPYRCHICGDKFRTQQYLKLHNRREHKETFNHTTHETDKDISKNKKKNMAPRLPAGSAREK